VEGHPPVGAVGTQADALLPLVAARSSVFSMVGAGMAPVVQLLEPAVPRPSARRTAPR
jgi:hypothetical protein